MNSLTFSVVRRPHNPTETIPWILHADGKTRRASDEEAALWDALAKSEERARVAENVRDQAFEATDHAGKGRRR